MIASLTFKVEENEANAEQELFDQIAQRCLHLIDQHTEAVLQVCFKSKFLLNAKHRQSDGWETTPLAVVSLILGRDSLKITNELPVVAALDRLAAVNVRDASSSRVLYLL